MHDNSENSKLENHIMKESKFHHEEEIVWRLFCGHSVQMKDTMKEDWLLGPDLIRAYQSASRKRAFGALYYTSMNPNYSCPS